MTSRLVTKEGKGISDREQNYTFCGVKEERKVKIKKKKAYDKKLSLAVAAEFREYHTSTMNISNTKIMLSIKRTNNIILYIHKQT